MPSEIRRELLGHQELELQMVVSYDVADENQTCVLCKSNKYLATEPPLQPQLFFFRKRFLKENCMCVFMHINAFEDQRCWIPMELEL